MSTTAAPTKAFAALGRPGYPAYLLTFLLTMTADNVEHVVSYWVAFQKFHSEALGGFAVLSHWLPFLLLSVPVGALNDRFDSRRLIQLGAMLMMLASAGWGYFFVVGRLEMWHAMALLVLHGCAGVLWFPSSQVLLYDLFEPAALPSAVRLLATTRYLGLLAGPAVGSLMMLTIGPTRSIFVNTVFYLPLMLWLVRAPYGRHSRVAGAPSQRAVRGLDDIVQTIREVRPLPVVGSMILLAGAASFFIGNSYHAQMPGFAADLGHGDPGTSYSMLLGADAAGALVGGILLEWQRGLFAPRAPTALQLAIGWAVSLAIFASCRIYSVALVCLFSAGFFELSFSSMAQTLVQMNAPVEARGRVLGLYNMAGSGLRAFSGVTVGLAGSVLGIHRSLALAACTFAVVCALIWHKTRRLMASSTTRMG